MVDRAAGAVATYGIVAFILCLPLEFTALFLGQQLSRYVLLIVAIAFAFLVVRRRRSILLPRSASAVVLALYVVASVGSWALARPPGSMSELFDVVLYPIVALLVMNVVVDEPASSRAWVAFLYSALGVALLGGLLSVTHVALWSPNPLVAARLNITFGDPNITARFLTLGACGAVLLYSARKGPSWLAWAAGVSCAAIVPLTLSRSGMLLFIVAAAFATAVAFNRRRAAAIAAVSIAVFLISTGFNPTTRQRADEAVSTVVVGLTGHEFGGAAGSAGPAHQQVTVEDNRTYLIAAGIKMFRDHPLIGVGFGGYQHALLTTYRRYVPANRSGANLDTLSHAALVTIMAEQGMVGTILFLAFLLALAVEGWRGRRRAGPSALWVTIPAALIVPIFVYSQIEGRLITEPYFWLSVGLLYSALMRQRAVPAETAEQPVQLRRVA